MTFDESTVLELGAHGSYRGAPFRLAGRTCVRSESGGLWNEWVLAFQDGTKKWLAEGRGARRLHALRRCGRRSRVRDARRG
jgi:hypothetical protein